MNRLYVFIGVAVLILGCSSEDKPQEIKIEAPLKIVPNTASELPMFDRKVEVAGIPTYAPPSVQGDKLLHAANVMAQYLDNDENGVVDNPRMVNQVLENKAFMFMWSNEAQRDQIGQGIVAVGLRGQDLGADETIIGWTPRSPGRFDASLEEVWHMITRAGFSQEYPTAFGEDKNSTLAKAMDQARGGTFEMPPNPYPPGAWYTYDDASCEYACMVAEYFYWAMTSILGAQAHRLAEIGQEWKLNTPELVRTRDAAVYKLLTDEQYRFPKVLPDGKYRE